MWYFVWEMSEIVVSGEEPRRNGLVNKPVEKNLSKHKEIQCIQIKRGYYFPRNINVTPSNFVITFWTAITMMIEFFSHLLPPPHLPNSYQ